MYLRDIILFRVPSSDIKVKNIDPRRFPYTRNYFFLLYLSCRKPKSGLVIADKTNGIDISTPAYSLDKLYSTSRNSFPISIKL